MRIKIYCPVCNLHFALKEEVQEGQQVICPICAARLEIVRTSPEIETRRYPQDPETEIRERVSLKDAYSISVEATGARRCRSAINLFLYPGDTVEVSGESYEVSIISYVINRGEEYMDVHEAR